MTMRTLVSLSLAMSIGFADVAPSRSASDIGARVVALQSSLEHAPCLTDRECEDMAHAHGIDPDMFGLPIETLISLCAQGDEEACDYASALEPLECDE